MSVTSWKLKIRRAGAIMAALATVGSLSACGGTGTPKGAATSSGGKRVYTVGFMPKTTADPFFVAADDGAKQAARELGMKLVYNGPATIDAAAQSQLIGQWTQEHLDAITVSANDPNALVPAMKQAVQAGVKVSTWNADVAAPGREFFMDNPTPQMLAHTLVTQVTASTGPKAKVLLITSTFTAPNQASWLSAIKALVAKQYPGFDIQTVLAGQADTATSFNEAKNWLQAHPETQAILTLDGNALAGAAQAVDAVGKKGHIVVTGIGVPSQNGPQILAGTVKSAVLWSPVDLGYAAMYMVHAQLSGAIKPGAQSSLPAGHLGKLKFITPDTILLGSPLVFTRANVRNYHF
ncbi:MAG: substrate-binding domain-containing protein [Solirubrobacteraceae bacterium]